MVEDDSPDTPSPDTGSSDTGSPDAQFTKTVVSTKREPDPYRREILLALIQHGSRPLGLLLITLALLFAIYCARCQIQLWMANAELVKFGSLELRVREAVTQSTEVGKQIKSLGDLTPDQLELFLIVGTQRNTDINYSGPEVSGPNLLKLQELGLLRNVNPDPLKLSWAPTEKGNQLHNALLGLVGDSISRAIRLPVCPECKDQTSK
jgi:hypothetical protein